MRAQGVGGWHLNRIAVAQKNALVLACEHRMRAKIRKFIETNFYVPEGEPLPDEGSLLDRGVIDSTGVLELIGFLQDEFGVEVADDEMLPENLDSIAKLEAYVSRKKDVAATA